MKKADFIAEIAAKCELSNAKAKEVVEAGINIIKEQLVKKEEVALSGLGTFSTKESKERNGVNPATGEKIVIAAKTSPKFQFAKPVKDAVKEA